jgi:hypothetical protein
VYLNYAGYAFFFVGFLCIIIHLILSSNLEVEHQDLLIMKNNYEDFSNNSLRESYNFPKKDNKGDLQNTNNSMNISNIFGNYGMKK